MSKRGGFHFATSQNADFSEIRSTRGSDPDYLYYNAQIINNSTSTITKAEDPEIRYQDTRSVPILQDKSNYAVSVENFTLNGAGKNLPIFIPQIREYNSDGSKNTNPNNTVYDVTLTIQYGGTKTSPSFSYQSTRSVQWIPENQATWTDQPAPLGLYSYPQEEIPYYYCYSYSHWVKLVNNALQLAWEDVISAAKTGGMPGLTIVINSLNGTFTAGQTVECFSPDNLVDPVGTAIVASFTGNTLVLYNTTGNFPVGFLVNQEPNVGVALISSVTIDGISVPEITLGTKCPFYTYDPKTNLFSLWQDANTCVVPFGSSQSGPQSVFGSSTASGYVAGEYSFVGYNTNFESLFTNWDTTYYSNQVKYTFGTSINSPTGLEPVGQSTAINTDGAIISSFSGNEMTVSWLGTPVEIASSNWVFGSPLSSASYVSGITGDSDLSFTLNNAPVVASYIKVGYLLTGTASNGNVIKGNVTSFDGTTLDLHVQQWKESFGSGWEFSLPITSDSNVTPIAGVSSSFDSVYSYQTPLIAGYQVQLNSSEGQSILGTITSVTETLGYTGGTGTTDEFLTYDNSTLPFGFSPQLNFQAQTGTFVVGDTVEGSTSKATGKIVEVTSGNQGTQNTIEIVKQTGSFVSGTTFTTPSGSGTITSIAGPNSASSIVRTGLITIGETYVNPSDSKTYYSGPFAVGDTIQDTIVTGNSAVITAIEGDNGYTTLSYGSQKNPFVIGHQVECYVSLDNTAQSARVCSGTVVDIIGDNLGYGTVNVGNQNGQFGIGEIIVNNADNSVATIVSIAGPNNGYGTVSYINQLTTGAPGSFIPGEFLLFQDNLDAFGKVILDTQNVINQTEGNIGSVTVITGVEINNVFTPTSNIPLPTAGQTIVGSQSGTVADFGGIVYLDSAVLTVNNVAGSFNVGDTIVDNVGFGLASSADTISVTATCNGFSYLGSGKLILKNTQGGTDQPASFGTSNIIIDFDSSNPPTQTNSIAMNIVGIPANRQFINGDPVQGSVSLATGIVIANCGSFPYPTADPSTQLLTILPDKGSAAFLEGELLYDERPSATLGGVTGCNGPFITGDLLTCFVGTATLSSAVIIPDSGEVTLTLTTSHTITVGSVIVGSSSGTRAKVLSGSGTSYIVNEVSGEFGQTEVITWSASGNIFSEVPLNNPTPNEIFLTNVSGVFPGSGGSLTNITRELVSFTGYSVSYDAGGPSSRVGTWRIPSSGETVYNWDKSENMMCMGFGVETLNITNPDGGQNYNSFFAVYQQLEQTFANGDSLGVLPFLSYTSGDTILPSGMNVTLNNNTANFVVGSPFYVFDIGNTVWISLGTVITIEEQSDGSYILDVSMKAYEQVVSTGPGVKEGDPCGLNPVEGEHLSTINKINYYTNGYVIVTTPTEFKASATFSASVPNSDTDGTIQFIKISPSSAYVQTSKPPANTTALTLTNIDGTFTNGSEVKDLTTQNYGSVQDFNETTNYTGEVTTLTVQNVVGIPATGNVITNSGKTATINSVSLSNGSFLVKPLTGTFTSQEQIIDLGSQAKATYVSQNNQHIIGLTSNAQATVLIDSGTQVKLAGLTGGTFEVGEEIQSSLGVQAQIVGFPLFGVGNTLVDTVSGATGIIVSDSGSDVVVESVRGMFIDGNQITSAGSTATINNISSPIFNIVPLSSAGESNSWVISPAPLTSSTNETPVGEGYSTFTTNLTIDQTIFDTGDDLVVTESDAILTVEQLYYPENVVQVDLDAGNCSVQTLQSLFPSGVTGPQYVVLVQDFESTSSLWSPVASIVIGTQFVTVREEYSGTPITIGTGNLGGNATTGSFQKVLLETPIEVLPQTSWRGLLFYEEKIEKLSSLGLSKEDLKNLDVQLYWRNRLTNSLTPLTLYNGGSANIRLLFKRIHE